jgi:hypothetical protein
MAMSEFARCIYLGDVAEAAYDDLDDDYLREIDVTRSSVELLHELAAATGL